MWEKHLNLGGKTHSISIELTDLCASKVFLKCKGTEKI